MTVGRNIDAQNDVAFKTRLARDLRIDGGHGMLEMLLHLISVHGMSTPPGLQNSLGYFGEESVIVAEVAILGICSLEKIGGSAAPRLLGRKRGVRLRSRIA